MERTSKQISVCARAVCSVNKCAGVGGKIKRQLIVQSKNNVSYPGYFMLQVFFFIVINGLNKIILKI